MKVSLSEARRVSVARKKSSPFTRFLREFSFIFTWLFANLGFSANMVTILGYLLAITGSILFMSTSAYFWLAGWVLLISYIIMDCVDGDIAVLKDNKTDFGAFLDLISHPITNSFLVLFMAIGAFNITQNLVLLVFVSTGSIMFVLTSYLTLFKENNLGESEGGNREMSYLNPVYFVKTLLFGPGGIFYPLIAFIMFDILFSTNLRLLYPIIITLVAYIIVFKRFLSLKRTMES